MEALSQDWFLIPIFLNLILFTYVKHNYGTYVSDVLMSSVSYKASSKIYRENKNVRPRSAFILNIVFILSFGLFSLQFLIIYVPDLTKFNHVLIILAGSFLVFSLTILNKFVNFISGFIFMKREISHEFNYNIDFFNQTLGIILFPLTFLISFSDIPKISVYVGLIAFGILYLLRIVRLLKINFNNRLNFFYMFLYLCTVEIVPMLYIGKSLKII
jgi:hypothetical protein